MPVLDPEQFNKIVTVQLLGPARQYGGAGQVNIGPRIKDIGMAQLQVCHWIKIA